MIATEREPEQAFAAPWHAEAFALAVHLNEAGHFCCAEWSRRFGKNLAGSRSIMASGDDGQGLDGSEDYYLIWLQTLIEVMQEKGIVDLETLDALKAQWIDAYIQTPHGNPVTLRGGNAC